MCLVGAEAGQRRLSDHNSLAFDRPGRKEMSKNDERQQVRAEFADAVNMSVKELERWLDTEESKSVGQSNDGGESKGHHSGRQIALLTLGAAAPPPRSESAADLR